MKPWLIDTISYDNHDKCFSSNTDLYATKFFDDHPLVSNEQIVTDSKKSSTVYIDEIVHNVYTE